MGKGSNYEYTNSDLYIKTCLLAESQCRKQFLINKTCPHHTTLGLNIKTKNPKTLSPACPRSIFIFQLTPTL